MGYVIINYHNHTSSAVDHWREPSVIVAIYHHLGCYLLMNQPGFIDPGLYGKPTGHHDDSENHDRSDGDCGLPWGSLMPILQHLQGILPGGCTTG